MSLVKSSLAKKSVSSKNRVQQNHLYQQYQRYTLIFTLFIINIQVYGLV